MGFIGIDAATLATPGTPAFRQTVEQLRLVTQGSGAFGVVNSGLSPALQADAMAAMRAWFALPEEVKARHPRAASVLPNGFHPQPPNGDRREKFLNAISWEAPGTRGYPVGRWPTEIEGLPATLQALLEGARTLGLDLLRGIAASLGVENGELWRPFENGGMAFWMLHYPAVTPKQGKRGQGTSSHTDFLPMTLIIQDPVGGLEVRDEHGAWHVVDPVAWPVVCQMGDMIGRWSNDRVKPSVHRVFNDATRARYSFVISPFPPFDTPVAPVSTCVDAEHPARYAVEPFGACLDAWMKALDDGTAGHRPDGTEHDGLTRTDLA